MGAFLWLMSESTDNISLAAEERKLQETSDVCSHLWNSVQQTRRLHVCGATFALQTYLGVCCTNYRVKGCCDLAIKLIRTKAPRYKCSSSSCQQTGGENHVRVEATNPATARGSFVCLICPSISSVLPSQLLFSPRRPSVQQPVRSSQRSG